MKPIVPSRELIRRTSETEVAYTLSRMNVLARLPGNPVGIAHREVGHGWALMARHLPVPGFNAVIGLEAGDAGELEALLQWYRDNDVRPQVEIVPGHEDAALTRELTRLGYHHSGFHASMIARPCDAVAPDPAIDVERVMDDAAFEDFLDAYVAGRELPDGAGFKRNVRPWLRSLDGRCSRACRWCARGCSGSLLARWLRLSGRCHDRSGVSQARIADHAAGASPAPRRGQGASYVSSGATFLSSSHRNMVRAGMTLQFVRALWTRL